MNYPSIYCWGCEKWQNVPMNWWTCPKCNCILDMDDNPLVLENTRDPVSETADKLSETADKLSETKDPNLTPLETNLNDLNLSSKDRGPFHVVTLRTDGEVKVETYNQETEFRQFLNYQLNQSLDTNELIQLYKLKNLNQQILLIEGGKIV